MASRLMPRLMDWVADVGVTGGDGRDRSLPAGHGGDVALDGASVEWLSVISFDQVPGAGGPTQCPVVDDEIHQHGQEGHVAVVVQLADRDPELVEVALVDDTRIVFE